MATPFEAHRGTQQQRIASANAAAGSYGYELGHATHLDVNLDSGDRHDVSQSFVVAAQATLVRATIRITMPDEVPRAWEFEALLNDNSHYTRRLNIASRLLVLRDVAVRLFDALSAPDLNVITYRLWFVGDVDVSSDNGFPILF